MGRIPRRKDPPHDARTLDDGTHWLAGGLLHTAHFQYIPALALPKASKSTAPA
jgi:hypothetical protein